MSADIRKLVYFDTWIHPIAEEILNAAPGIEMIRLDQNDDEACV